MFDKFGAWQMADREAADLWEVADEAKLAELLLYVADALMEDPAGGATKVNKVLYYAETAHVRAHGVPITGGPYRKLPNGPAPTFLVQIRNRLIANDEAELRHDEYFGYALDRLVPLRAIDRDLFTLSERHTTDQVVKAFWGMTAQQLSDRSHKERPYILAKDDEDIPLYTAFLSESREIPDFARARAKELAAELGLLS
jgi:uncharacterized phage-associated protein